MVDVYCGYGVGDFGFYCGDVVEIYVLWFGVDDVVEDDVFDVVVFDFGVGECGVGDMCVKCDWGCVCEVVVEGVDGGVGVGKKDDVGYVWGFLKLVWW